MQYIISATYDYLLNCIVLKLYNDETQQLESYYDNVFKPYFYARERQHFDGILSQEQVELYDALHDEKITVWKVTVKSPDIIYTFNKESPEVVAWENHIKFVMQYIYDGNLKMGMPYIREHGTLILNIDKAAEKRVEELRELIKPEQYNQVICEQIARLLEYPAPEFKRTSLDIEVLSEGNKMPSPHAANLPVICVCLTTNNGQKFAFALIQADKIFKCISDAEVTWFSNEAELLKSVFKFVEDYSFVITFNGDDFDLPYLMNRSLRLGVPASEIPIIVNEKEKIAYWKDAIHIDLYKFFSIKSMQNYAFQQKYKNVTLDEVSFALIKKGKIKGEHEWVNDMNYEELLTYCLRDAELTIELTTYDNNLVMNLILVLARLSYMPMEMVSRKPISQWIRSMLYYEHGKTTLQLMNDSTKRLIYEKLHYCKYGENNQCPIMKIREVLLNDIMKTIEKKNWNEKENIVNCINPTQNLKEETELLPKNGMVYTEKNTEKKIKKNSENGTENGYKATQNNGNNICVNMEKENKKNIENINKKDEENSLILKGINVNDVIQLMREYLKSIIKGGEIKEEIVTQVLEKIGMNCNYCVPIATELFMEKNTSTLIPRSEDIIAMKGQTTTTALIKGKKYKGAIVVEPVAGFHFNTKVADFASLYPSILKNYNLGYNTIRCNHEECQSNKVIGLSHWVCTKNRAIESKLIGTMKGLRVIWYKKQAKDNQNPRKQWYFASEQTIKVICNACFTPDTKVLTPNGFKYVTDFMIGDSIYSINPHTKLIENDEIVNVQKYLFNGNLVGIKSHKIDLKTTPTHKYLLGKSEDKYQIKEAKDLKYEDFLSTFLGASRRRRVKPPSRVNLSQFISDKSRYKITKKSIKDKRKNSKRVPISYKTNDFLEFLAWYITEGSITNYPEYNTKRISISQKVYKSEVELLLKKMKVPLHYNNKEFAFHSNAWAEVLELNCGVYSENKHIPKWIFSLNKPFLKLFFEKMKMGDGDKNRNRYTTISFKLAEDVAHILILLGYSPCIKKEKNIYRISWRKSGVKVKNNKYEELYNGLVYCITAKKNHFIIAGRNNIYNITGQSYGVFGNESFVFYAPAIPESITGIGRWIITQTIKHAQELGLIVIAGDTDSVFFKDPRPEVLEELLIWAKEKFDIDFELDKEYRYACLSGRKKNYFGVLKDGTVDVKGLTGKKKHTPQIIKTPFEETKKLLAQVYTEQDIQTAKKAILRLVKDTYTKLKTRNFGDIENLAFHVTTSKEVNKYEGAKDSEGGGPQHVKAAKLLQKAGYDVGEGSDISYVKTKDRLKVKPTMLAKIEDVDVSKYIEFLKATFDQVLEPLGVDWSRDILGVCVLDRWSQQTESV